MARAACRACAERVDGEAVLRGAGNHAIFVLRLAKTLAGSSQDSVLGSRRLCAVEQTVGGRHVRHAVRRWRRGTPARDYSARISGSAERDRPATSHAGQALSAVRLRTKSYHFVLGRKLV